MRVAIYYLGGLLLVLLYLLYVVDPPTYESVFYAICGYSLGFLVAVRDTLRQYARRQVDLL